MVDEMEKKLLEVKFPFWTMVLPLRVEMVADGALNAVDDVSPKTESEPVLVMVTAPLRVEIVADVVRNEVDEATPMTSRFPFKVMFPLRVGMVADGVRS